MRPLTLLLSAFLALPAAAAPQIDGCPVFPTSNPWNTPVDALPVHPLSNSWITTMDSTKGVHPDFGTVYQGAPIGIPFVSVPGSQANVAVTFDFSDESDPGPYPIPSGAPIEGGPDSNGDRHVLVIDRDNCLLYEMYYAFPNADGSWSAASGAKWNLRSNALRPKGWTSADAAGLAIFPGLARYDEVAAGAIEHALRFTAPQTRRAYIWPAQHYASNLTGDQYPPMGVRLRLKAGFDISTFSPQVQVILRALKKYGMLLADNGSAWFISGAPDSRWDDDMLVTELARVKGSDFEAVDATFQGARTNPATLVAREYYDAGIDHYFVATGDSERAAFDSGSAGAGWVSTGLTFSVSPGPAEGWLPVCAFSAPASRFLTVDPGECELVKGLRGWMYEGTAFHAVPLQAGACPAGLRALWRAYNNGFPTKDANHRYSTDRSLLDAMVPRGWSVEGVAMCVE